MKLPATFADEVAALAAAYGPTAFVEAEIPDGMFDPVRKTDRYGEVCMVIRRPGGRLLTFRKDFYPAKVMRLLTGGVHLGETIAAGLAREVAEETSLAVQVRRLLAVIGYRTQNDRPGEHRFYSFAFLLDEIGGTLAVQDLEERVEAWGEVEPAQLRDLAAVLEGLDEQQDREIGGSWRSWGLFRAVVHHVVAVELEGSNEV